MKLYYAPGACSLAPHIVIREIGLPVDLIRVDTKNHTLADGSDYYAINPRGQVPLLELEDGSRLTEGPVIVQYLADQAEARSLMPAPGTMARYRVMEWQNYITSELHKGFSPLFGGGFDDQAKALMSAQLQKKFAWVSQQLEKTPYLTGDSFTAADAYLFVVSNWSRFVGLDLSAQTALLGFQKRVAERPAVQAALKAEGLVK